MGFPVVHFEIGCKDKDKTAKFYKALFDWKVEEMGPAAMINTGSETGIQGHINSLGHEPHNYITVYALVPKLEDSIAKAEKLGAKVVVPPQEVPDMGRFSWIADPEGNVFGLWQAFEE
jgi:predicted enzyme related to lactoylglutathione lyase